MILPDSSAISVFCGRYTLTNDIIPLLQAICNSIFPIEEPQSLMGDEARKELRYQNALATIGHSSGEVSSKTITSKVGDCILEMP